jgi:hypothetical protein
MNRRKRPKGDLEIGFSAGAFAGRFDRQGGGRTEPEFFI